MNKNYNGIFLLCVALLWVIFLGGCSDPEEACERTPAYPGVTEMEIERLDEQIFGAKTEQEVRQILTDNPAFTGYFLDGDQYPSTAIIARNLHGLSRDKAIDTLRQEMIDVFGNFDELSTELANAYSWLKVYYPEANVPLVKTVLTGMYNDLFVSDSVLIIGADYFIGNTATFRPINTPQYILKRYEKESILPLVFSFVSNEYMEIDKKDNTLLADMINYGRSYYFTKKMMPCKSDGWIVGYDEEEMKMIKANQEQIWAHFINRALFYETNHFVKNKYTGERPNVFEIGDQCPGRIARWLGWEIVNAYMARNPEVTLNELMKETDMQKILTGSKFKAKNQ
ncbi:MAG: gliding motility lipoprotein GldB [Bacteroidota bacterium]